MIERISEFVASDAIFERCIENAFRRCERDSQLERERFSHTQAALQENQSQIDQMLTTIASGGTSTALLEMLGEKATQLKIERERLRIEERELKESLQPVEGSLDVEAFRENLMDFVELAKRAKPEELQWLLGLMVRRVEWKPDGQRDIEYFCLPKKGRQNHWFHTEVCSDGPEHHNCERAVVQLERYIQGGIKAYGATLVAT